MTDAKTVHEVTYDLLRELGLTTVFGNPGSTEQTFLKNFPDDFTYVLGLQEASVLAMAEGFRHTLASTGRPGRVIMLRAGSDAELSSGVDREQTTLLAALPAVARGDGGRPLASAELVVMVELPRRGETRK